MPPPDLSRLRLFTAVARLRNFRAAARDCQVSASTLSQAVRELEEQMGVRLLNRTTRSVTPTPAGERLLQRLSPIFAELAEAVDDINSFSESPSGTLRLNVPTMVAKTLLPPLLTPFLAAYPRLVVDLVDDNSFIDVFAAGFDAGVRFGESLAQDMVAVPLGGRQRFVLVASPDHLARQGRPTSPHDLLGRPCIRHRFHSGAIQPWEFEKDGHALKLTVTGPLITTSSEAAIATALDGLGWCYTFESFVADHVKNGRLVPVLDDWCPFFPSPYLYYPSRRHVPAGLRAFIDFITARKSEGIS